MVAVASLDSRQRSILSALVYEYIATGIPAGSRTLSRKYGLGVSAATVRNTMSDLEDLGLVYQPHTSAGRLPTDHGIRFFVDALMDVRELTDAERSSIEQRYGEVLLSVDGWDQVVRALSEMTQQPAIVRSPKPDGAVLRQLRFLPLSSGQILAVLIDSSGVAQSRLLPISVELAPTALERIHNYLNELIPGRTLAEARKVIEREAQESRESLDRNQLRALELGRDALGETGDAKPTVHVHGQARLVQAGTSVDIERLRQQMELLEDQERLSVLLEATSASDGPFIVIGGEHPMTEIAGCAVIAAPYSRGTDSWGALAVLGPRSMDYAKMVPLVGFTAQVLSAIDEDEAG